MYSTLDVGFNFLDETLAFTATATDQDLPAQNLTFTLDAAAITAGMTIDPNFITIHQSHSPAQKQNQEINALSLEKT